MPKQEYPSRDQKRKERQQALELLGGVCKRCGFADPRALQIDHIAGDGWKGPKTTLHMVQTYPERYQLLCANCNWIKRVENREYRVGPGSSTKTLMEPFVSEYLKMFDESH